MWNATNVLRAIYHNFSVADEADGFRLKVDGFVSGDLRDLLAHHNDVKFSTYDMDNDASSRNCAGEFKVMPARPSTFLFSPND